MKIQILIPSKKLKRFEQDWIDEYSKRLKRYSDFGIDYLKDTQDHKTFEKRMDPQAIQIALCPEGKSFSTEGLAKWIQNKQTQATKKMQFMIGGSYGLPELVTRQAHLKLSLSEFTFPHRLALLILCEQLYRTQSFLAGEPYHHG